MNIENIRDYIQMDAEGKLPLSKAIETMGEIESFKKAHHYLPKDIANWYDQMQDWMEEQQAELDEQMEMEAEIKEEYEAYVWEQYLK